MIAEKDSAPSQQVAREADVGMTFCVERAERQATAVPNESFFEHAAFTERCSEIAQYLHIATVTH